MVNDSNHVTGPVTMNGKNELSLFDPTQSDLKNYYKLNCMASFYLLCGLPEAFLSVALHGIVCKFYKSFSWALSSVSPPGIYSAETCISGP
jgi:hypothetical protein